MKIVILFLSALMIGCGDVTSGNPEPTDQQVQNVKCAGKGGTLVYENSGYTCANPHPSVSK